MGNFNHKLEKLKQQDPVTMDIMEKLWKKSASNNLKYGFFAGCITSTIFTLIYLNLI